MSSRIIFIPVTLLFVGCGLFDKPQILTKDYGSYTVETIIKNGDTTYWEYGAHYTHEINIHGSDTEIIPHGYIMPKYAPRPPRPETVEGKNK